MSTVGPHQVSQFTQFTQFTQFNSIRATEALNLHQDCQESYPTIYPEPVLMRDDVVGLKVRIQ